MRYISVATMALAGALWGLAGGPVAAQIVHKSIEPRDLAREKKPVPKPYRPPFSEFPFLLGNPEEASPLAPPSFLQAPQYAFPAEKKRPGLSVLPGQTVYNLETPPTNNYWWRRVEYSILGMPRDLIDGFFGLVGYVPVVNLPLTGGYELLGMQYLMRDAADYHEYGGLPNKNKHAWIGGDSWGWFSIRHQCVFREVDQARREQWNKNNERVEAALRQRNDETKTYNEKIDHDARTRFETARQDWEAGRYADALARFWVYCNYRPADYPARAYLVACCIQQAGAGVKYADWCEQETRRELAAWSGANAPALVDVLRRDAERRPDDAKVRFWLTWIHARMGSFAEALTEGRQLGRHPKAGLNENVLYYEICMIRLQQLDPAKDADSIRDLLGRMENAVERMRRAAEKSPETRLAVARLNVLNGRYAEGLAELEALALENPDSAKYAYYYAAGLIFRGLFGHEYDQKATVDVLQRAQRRPASPERRTIIAEALAQAQKIPPQTPLRPPSIAE